MDIIYRINGSDLTRDKNVSYSPQIGWKVTFNEFDFFVKEISVNLDEREQTLYVELTKSGEYLGSPANGIAKCVQPFDRSGNLTLTKHYPILKVSETHFFITDDNGNKRGYKHGNSQFTIY